jgi:riboflavin biosynthesis pyrimidine reductase
MAQPDAERPNQQFVTQTYPISRRAPLEGLYLADKLASIPPQTGHSLVFANFLTDRNGVIATAAARGNFQVPLKIKNASDWRLFQELMAQADVIISGAAYLKRAAVLGAGAQNVLSQFEAGGEFEDLGAWRLNQGYARRSPDLAVVTHSLAMTIPDSAVENGRKLTLFTTGKEADSGRAAELRVEGIGVIGGDDDGVDGDTLVDSLSEMGYRVIQMATGPRVLELLLKANRLDRLYISEAQVEIKADDPAAVKTVLPAGQSVHRLPGFHLFHEYLQGDVLAANSEHISQHFLRFDRN